MNYSDMTSAVQALQDSPELQALKRLGLNAYSGALTVKEAANMPDWLLQASIDALDRMLKLDWKPHRAKAGICYNLDKELGDKDTFYAYRIVGCLSLAMGYSYSYPILHSGKSRSKWEGYEGIKRIAFMQALKLICQRMQANLSPSHPTS